MVDDVVLNKISTIERCVARVREEYEAEPASFATNYTRQDAATLNIQRACEAAIDLGQHLIRKHQLGVTQSARDVFTLLESAQQIEPATAKQLKNMVSYRNIAVHDYQTLVLPITLNIIQYHLSDLLDFCQQVLKGQQ
jgi:uncharacterized protein YutE (UPF0331/DUF86 family)